METPSINGWELGVPRVQFQETSKCLFFPKGSAFSLAVGFAVQPAWCQVVCTAPRWDRRSARCRGARCVGNPRGTLQRVTGDTLPGSLPCCVFRGKKGEGAHPFRYSGKVVIHYITLHVIAIVSATITGCFLHTGCSWRWRRAFPIFSRWKYCWVGKYLGQQQKPVACGTTIHFRLLMMFVPIFCEFLRVSMVPSPFSSIFTWFSPGVCFKSP